MIKNMNLDARYAVKQAFHYIIFSQKSLFASKTLFDIRHILEKKTVPKNRILK